MNRTIRLLSMLFLGCVCVGHGATRTWMSSVGGLWTSTANWSDGTLPGANDIADLSAAAGTITLTADVIVGEILYNPTGSGKKLTILSDPDATSSQMITLTTTATRHIQVGTGAELVLDVDFKPTGMWRKDGYGTLVLKRRMPGTVRTDFQIEQGRLVNEGAMSLYACRIYLGTVESDAGDAPELVLREGSSCFSTLSSQGSDLILGGNSLLGNGPNSRAVITHEGGLLDMSTNAVSGVFLHAYAVGGSSVYNLSGGEVNMQGRGVWAAFHGDGTINQTGGKLKAGYLNFSQGSTGSGTYNLLGGELWLGGVAKNNSGTAEFNIGGAAIYPMGSGFSIYDSTKPKLTGVNGPARFCASGSGYTNYLRGLTGTGGFSKEGPDTLVLSGSAHSFTGPVTVTNGTLNVTTTMNGGNAVLVAGGAMNIGAGVTVKYSSLMVAGGVFQVASGSTLTLPGNMPLVQVAGTGSIKMLDGASLPGATGLAVSESGAIDLSAGGTATVYRLILDGVEQTPGFYNSGNCAAITGSGTLAVNIGAWSGAGGDMLWSTSTNWISGRVPTGFSSTADLSAAVSNEAPVGTLVFDLSGVTNNTLMFDSGVAGAMLTNTCPEGITNTLYMQSSGAIYVGEGETLVLDHDLCLMGDLNKYGEGTLVLQRGTFALPSIVTPSAQIKLQVEAGQVICCGAMTNVVVMVGKPERGVPGITPEFILEDTPQSSISGVSFISAMSYLPTSFNPGNGVFTQNGGVVTPGISWQTKSQIGFSVAGAAWGATGTYNLVKGTFIVTENISLAAGSGVGVFNQSGGVADFHKLVLRRGEIYLTGGLLMINVVDNTYASYCLFRLGGGRLEPKSSTTVALGSAVEFTGEGGNMTFAPAAGQAITLLGELSGAGGFIKDGDGYLTISGAGYIAGPVVVSNGTLSVSGNNGLKLGELAVTNGTLHLAAESVIMAESFFIEGVEWTAGLYTASNCVAISGDGLLVVGAELGQWTNGGVDDNWSTTDNWVAGILPSKGFATDLSAAVSNAAPVRTLIMDLDEITNHQIIFDSGVTDAVLTNTCPDGVTNKLYISSEGFIDVGEGQTLVLDHDLSLMGGIHKRGMGTLVLRRGTTARYPGAVIYLYVDAGKVINEGALRDVMVSVGKLVNTDVGAIPEFILADTPDASIGGLSFITALNASSLAPGPGIFTQNGGTVNPAIGWGNRIAIGHTAVYVDVPGTGTYNLVKGTLTVTNNVSFGRNGALSDGHYGIFNQSGGTADVGTLTGAYGELHLTGGLFKLNSMHSSVQSGVSFNLGGGRLEPKSGTLLEIASPTLFTGINGEMTFAPQAGRTIQLSGASTGPAGFIKEEAGTLMLSGAHAFEGDARIRAGSCQITSEGTLTECTNLMVSADARLTLQRSGAALNTNLWLKVTADGKVDLDFEGDVEVGHLVLNGQERQGQGKRYGSSSCTAELDYVMDDYFTGTGVLKVVGPRGRDGTVIILR